MTAGGYRAARHSRPVRVHRRIARRCRADPGAQRDRRSHRARHDLGSKTLDEPVLAVDAALRLLP